MPKILINFATRSRPTKFFNCMDNIMEMLSNENEVQIIVTADVDDATMCNEVVRDKVERYPNTKIYYGISENKIDAINKNISLADDDWDIVLNMSDDFWFIKKGFDVDIVDAYSNGFTGLAHFPDGFVNERLCTFTIYDRAYYSRFGYIYFNKYMSVYADNEQHDVAKILGCYKYINKKIMEHRHFVHGFGEKDALLQRTEERTNYAIDGALYKERKKYNFYL